MNTRSPREALLAAAVAMVLAAGGVALASSEGGRGIGDAAVDGSADPSEAVVAEVSRFLADHVTPEGRVVRHDQGGDTVSEGQAYGMLLAVGIGDRGTFDRIWSWTDSHLRRPDGLLSWRWADGQVVDAEPAADADLDAAWALALAGDRWPEEDGYRRRARDLAAAVEAHETVAVDGQRVLVAGPWAVGDAAAEPHVFNPSYASPVADAVLAAEGLGDPRALSSRSAGNRAAIVALLDRGGIPTDWARVAGDGSIRSTEGPVGGGPGNFGWDAVRVPLRYSASCAEADQHVAEAVWPAMESGGAGVDRLGDHPARLVGAAAAAAAADELDRAEDLLDEASDAQRAEPTYYGGALTALGYLLLTSDALGSCPPLAG